MFWPLQSPLPVFSRGSWTGNLPVTGFSLAQHFLHLFGKTQTLECLVVGFFRKFFYNDGHAAKPGKITRGLDQLLKRETGTGQQRNLTMKQM